ncbi:hypothetical protein CMO96_00690 [Candidatus Woesebacteria bacterium]|nr:hypothetical protein [Candidatus Woesebacteria bacterium]
MKVYFAASTSGIQKFGGNYRYILRVLKSLGPEVMENWFVAKLGGKGIYKNSDDLVRGETHLLAQADFVVAEISAPSFGVGYVIKQALDQRKPVLCLYPDNMDPASVSDVFLGSTSNLLRVGFYSRKTLHQILDSNLDVTQFKGLAKFNFLITPDIATYLDWAVKSTKQSKSEFLRDAVVKNLIKNDKEYKRFVRKLKARK